MPGVVGGFSMNVDVVEAVVELVRVRVEKGIFSSPGAGVGMGRS